MFFARAKTNPRLLPLLLLFLLAAGRLAAAPSGPTLQLDYGRGQPQENPVSKFMYFVPLISPGPSTIFTNVGNAQYARVLSSCCRTNGKTFLATCEFEFTGTGSLQNIFDSTEHIRAHEQDLKSGAVLKHQLGAINVEGHGSGRVVVEGTLAGGALVVDQVSIHFNEHGHLSPVTVNLQDFAWRNGAVRTESEMVARVNTLTFRRAAGTPKMEVSLASIKRKDASQGLWQNFLGGIKGMTANLFLPPLTIEAEGQQTMLEFGLALATENREFTFPFAKRLKSIRASEP